MISEVQEAAHAQFVIIREKSKALVAGLYAQCKHNPVLLLFVSIFGSLSLLPVSMYAIFVVSSACISVLAAISSILTFATGGFFILASILFANIIVSGLCSSGVVLAYTALASLSDGVSTLDKHLYTVAEKFTKEE